MTLTCYEERKKDVLESYDKIVEVIADLRSYAKRINMPDPCVSCGNLISAIRDKAEQINQDVFRLMIAGEAKSGKSTFINAYLGVRDLLPTDVKQCTSSIVEIKYGQIFSVKATYADERKETFLDSDARKFLNENAALNDEYRGLPISTINNEILIKSGRRSLKQCKKSDAEQSDSVLIREEDINSLLEDEEIKKANIHNLPDYDEKIRAYIGEKKDSWKNIVTKIEVTYPFDDSALRGIEIVDSPGVCARGGVSEITSEYIKNADAIIFLKPISGQALESTEFNDFMVNASVQHNKNTLFLVLTRAANLTAKDLRRQAEEAYKQFSNLDKRNILIVDSKAEMYAKLFQTAEDVTGERKRLKDEGVLDDFVNTAYYETIEESGSFQPQIFIDKLKEVSRFDSVYESLGSFGRIAHYCLLKDLLDLIDRLYNKLWNDTIYRIDMYRTKAEDPSELAIKAAKVKQDWDNIKNQLSRGVDEIVRKYTGDEGLIRKITESEAKDFEIRASRMDAKEDGTFNKLENLSKSKVQKFIDLQTKLQHNIVNEFETQLMELSNKDSIVFTCLNPDFTSNTFEEIKHRTELHAKEIQQFKDGVTFKEVHTRSVYVQDRHFNLIKNSIISRLEQIKSDLTENLFQFINNIRSRYIDELSKNLRAKKTELDAIEQEKFTAEQTIGIIDNFKETAKEIKTKQNKSSSLITYISGIIGDIKNVQ